MALPQRTKAIILIGGALIFAFVVNTRVFKIKKGELRIQEKKLEEVKEDYDYVVRLGDLEVDKRKLEKARVQKLEEAAKGNLEIAEIKLPSKTQKTDVLKQLADLAVKCGVIVVSIKTSGITRATPEGFVSFEVGGGGKGTGEKPYLSIPIYLSLRCSYPNLVAFLEEMRKLPRIITVEHISIEHAKGPLKMLNVKTVIEMYVKEATGESGI